MTSNIKFALVGFSDKQVHRVEIKEELIRRGHVCDLMYFPTMLLDGHIIERTVELLSKYDVVHHLVAGGNGELVKMLQERLLEVGVICPNLRVNASNLDDKVIQMTLLAKDGIPVPRSVRLVNPTKEEVAELISFPFVLKEPRGSKGAQVAMCDENNFDKLIKKNTEYLGQQLIDYGADYRVHIAGDQTFCAYERVAPKGDFRANVSLGGAMKKINDPALLTRLSELALRAAKTLSMDYGGVDILSDKKGNLLVLEFNSNPGFKDVSAVTGTPFYKPIADYYESLVA